MLMGGLIAFGLIASYAHTMKHQILAAMPTTTTVPAAPLAVRWSCPAPSQGWTATMTWPAGDAAPDDWMVQTAPVTGGAWTIAATGFGNRPVQVKHLAAGQAERVRAGSLISLEVSGRAITDGQITPPPGC